MPRIPYPDPAKLPDNIRKQFEAAPINVVKMMAGASPAVFEGFGKFSGAFYGPSKLPANLREIAILRVGYLSKSRYETYQHEALARQVGHGDAQIEAIKHGGQHPGVLSDVQQAVLDFTDDVVLNVRASDATLGAVRKHLPDEEVLDLIMVIGLYMAVSRFLETCGVELDGAPLDWKNVVNRSTQ
ncbi:MAG TPA: carboxymuconolactone decarboxylase family protein [Alphaproteobacteria bacterium]|nr:carboxymuconolactone decarboxylase family protein [Alphaproteobacteria bacterium]